jgi:hypothetical protein
MTPKTLADMWAHYRNQILLAHYRNQILLPLEHLEPNDQTRLAFYAGAACILRSLAPLEALCTELDGLSDELAAYDLSVYEERLTKAQ